MYIYRERKEKTDNVMVRRLRNTCAAESIR
jgi:hypothetical protein